MSDTMTDVLVAGYRDLDLARRDFDTLMADVTDKRAKIQAAILVS